MNNIVIFLNGTRGIKVIESLKKNGHSITACVIPSDQKFQNVHNQIKNINLKCLRVKNLDQDNTYKKLKNYRPKIFIIAGYSTIFKEELINLPEKGTINLHAGGLPEYRGGSPLNWQIINGEKKAKISIIKVDQGIDTGKILKEKNIPINSLTEINDLHNKANTLFPKMVCSLLQSMDKKKNLNAKTQNSKNAVYWHQRQDRDGHLDFKNMSSNQVSRFVRALTYPYPGAWAVSEEIKVRIHKITIPKFRLQGTPGRICYIQNKGPYVICKDRAILVEEYLFENNSDFKLKHGQYLK